MIPLWLTVTLIAVAAYAAGFLTCVVLDSLTYRRREAVDVDLTGRHPDRVDLDWQEPHGRVPLHLRTSNVASPAEIARTLREQSPSAEPKDAA